MAGRRGAAALAVARASAADGVLADRLRGGTAGVVAAFETDSAQRLTERSSASAVAVVAAADAGAGGGVAVGRRLGAVERGNTAVAGAGRRVANGRGRGALRVRSAGRIGASS